MLLECPVTLVAVQRREDAEGKGRDMRHSGESAQLCLNAPYRHSLAVDRRGRCCV